MNYKIIFLIFSLFFINNAFAEVILQENFNTQTSGNFSVFAGTPTYPETFYIYSIFRDPSANVILRNTSTGNENISYIYYVNVSNNYNFITTFYNNETFSKYYEISFRNTSTTSNEYFIDCNDGINGYHSDTQSINLNNYKDENGWTKIENTINTTNNILKINDVEVLNSNLGICSYNKNVTEIIFNRLYPFYIDNILLTNLSDVTIPISSDIIVTSSLTTSRLSTCNSTRAYSDIVFPLMGLLLMIFGLGTIFVTLKSGFDGGTILGTTIFAGVLVAIIGFGLMLVGNYLLYLIYNVTC